jgi:hypothetical protein
MMDEWKEDCLRAKYEELVQRENQVHSRVTKQAKLEMLNSEFKDSFREKLALISGNKPCAEFEHLEEQVIKQIQKDTDQELLQISFKVQECLKIKKESQKAISEQQSSDVVFNRSVEEYLYDLKKLGAYLNFETSGAIQFTRIDKGT